MFNYFATEFTEGLIVSESLDWGRYKFFTHVIILKRVVIQQIKTRKILMRSSPSEQVELWVKVQNDYILILRVGFLVAKQLYEPHMSVCKIPFFLVGQSLGLSPLLIVPGPQSLGSSFTNIQRQQECCACQQTCTSGSIQAPLMAIFYFTWEYFII